MVQLQYLYQHSNDDDSDVSCDLRDDDIKDVLATSSSVPIFDVPLTVFAAEVTVVVKVIGSSVSAPSFARREYNVTVAESTPRYTSLITITAQSDVTGN